MSKTYGAVRALADVDFEIGPGEVVGVAGENGSGKSTLAKILAGVVVPDAGEILVDGEPRNFSRPRDALKVGVALVSQEGISVPALSVAENVLLATGTGVFQRFKRRAAARDARAVLERVGVFSDPMLPLRSLSPAQRERVEIARALATNPRVLILDEATSRLGETVVERLFDLVRELRDEGTSTIIISHRLREYCEVADRVFVLRDGRHVGDLPGSDVKEEELARLMVGRELKALFAKKAVSRGAPVLKVDELVAPGARGPVSLEVGAGEIVGLAGLVGSGRTELLETIAGIRKSHGGSVSVNGTVLPPGNPRAAITSGVTLLPEERRRQGLILHRPVTFNIAMGSWRPTGVPRQRAERQLAEGAVESLRIRLSSVDAPVRSLSGGNQQKVVLARCLAGRPKVLLLDEPTRGIDVGAKAEVYGLIGEMVSQGIAIVLASSEMIELLGIADRIVVLHERAAVAEMNRAEATEERVAHLAAGGR